MISVCLMAGEVDADRVTALSVRLVLLPCAVLFYQSVIFK